MRCPPVRPSPGRFGSSGSSTVDLPMLIITNGDHEAERLGSVTASTGCWTQLAGARSHSLGERTSCSCTWKAPRWGRIFM
jgi:hypothetical protein